MKNKEQKSGSNILLVTVFVIIIVMLLGLSIRPLLQANELKAQLEELQLERDELKQENDKLEYRLGLALDEDNIRRIAKEELGLVDPKDEYYIGD